MAATIAHEINNPLEAVTNFIYLAKTSKGVPEEVSRYLEIADQELARVAHSLGEVVGLGLRNLAHCPVELNLMPESTLNWVQFNQKKPYLMASAFSLVLIVFAAGFIFQKLSGTYQGEIDQLEGKG